MKRSGRERPKSSRKTRGNKDEKWVGRDWGGSRGRQRGEFLSCIRSGQGRANGKNRDFAGPFSMTRHSAGRVVSRRILFAPIRHGGTALMGRGETRLIRTDPRWSGAHRFTAQVADKGKAWQGGQDQRERDDKPASALHDRRRQPERRSVHSSDARALTNTTTGLWPRCPPPPWRRDRREKRRAPRWPRAA